MRIFASLNIESYNSYLVLLIEDFRLREANTPTSFMFVKCTYIFPPVSRCEARYGRFFINGC